MASVLDASDEASLSKQVKKIAQGLGFELFALGLEINRPMVDRISHTTTDYPQAWQQIYEERNYIAIDPTVKHCRESSNPLMWTDQLRHGETADFWAEARAYGIVHGMSIPSHAHSGVSGRVSLSRDQPLPSQYEEAMRMFNGARVLATCAHFAAMRILVPVLLERHDPQLSKRETECVAWAAQGKTSTEIGEKLHIAEPTVEFHFKKVMRKLGVRNRIQAIALSMALGLVS